jgi:hypothetical protein
MPDVAKRLAGPALLTAAAATQYTVPAATTTILRNVHVSNETAATATFTLSIGTDAAGKRLWTAVDIPTKSSLDWSGFIVLNAADVIQAFSGTALQLGFQDQGRLDRGDFSSLQQGRQLGARALREIVYRDQLKRTAGGGYDFAQLDQIVNNARRWGIAPQLVLTNRKGSGMGDPKKYAEFVRAAAKHFKGRVGRYSLENEPDLRMAPEKYRRLYDAGQRARPHDPRAQVLFGEFSPTTRSATPARSSAKGGLTASGFAWHPYQDTDPLGRGTNPYWGQSGRSATRARSQSSSRGSI